MKKRAIKYFVKCHHCKGIRDTEEIIWFNLKPICVMCLAEKQAKGESQ